jgi:hypothetical protein
MLMSFVADPGIIAPPPASPTTLPTRPLLSSSPPIELCLCLGVGALCWISGLMLLTKQKKPILSRRK